MGGDFDGGADSHQVEQLDHIRRPHPDAAVARGGADARFLRRAVDVNRPAKGVGILLSDPPQPGVRETIGSRPGAFGLTISPVGRRLFSFMPLGSPAPIF